jgi:hypothetical protein
MTRDHLDLVQAEAARAAPERTVAGALAFVLRVIARINAQTPEDPVGLLIKTAGENITPYTAPDGTVTLVSASRLCWADQKLVKILSDVPATNGPEWLEDGDAHVGGFIGGYLAVRAPEAPPPVPLPVSGVDPTLPGVAERLAALEAKIDALIKAPPKYRGTIMVFGRTTEATFDPVIS